MTGEADTETEKRTNTLSSILVTITGVIILIIAILTILPEFGVNITTLLSGIGVGGLAIAFVTTGCTISSITLVMMVTA